MQKVTTFLMFEGKAEEAMNFYISLFENAQIKNISHYAGEIPGKDGLVKQAIFSIDGQEFMCIDSPAKHDFNFTPSISLFINCKTEEEADLLFEKLSDGGKILMPLNKYPFSDKFGWCADRYGVSWQLNFKK
jgi:predicted 3-demethylubiquinone-9 3-methyltransferase (glyoxalase superfamily)